MGKAKARFHYLNPSIFGERIRFLRYSHMLDVLVPVCTLVYGVLRFLKANHQHSIDFRVTYTFEAVVLIFGNQQLLLKDTRETSNRARRTEDGSLVQMREVHDLPSNRFCYIMEDSPTDWTTALRVIDVGSEEQRLEGIIFMYGELTEIANVHRHLQIPDHIEKDIDKLVQCLGQLVREFSGSNMRRFMNGCGLYITSPAVDVLFTLEKDNVRPTFSFVSLINSLPFPRRNLEFENFAGMLGTIDELDISSVLFSIDLYLKEVVPVNTRSDFENDPTLLVITNIIKELVELRGRRIEDHLSLLPPRDSVHTPIVLTLIDKYLHVSLTIALC
ncbi:hypothetical protein POM88_031548 [Heracleum sosnowskyi]|uniref:Uncharacterized protein n=1 Tax=Heracleum sosnowskyi TaxID=360622 RepID=A0AAD8I0J8_9APIA|nr:hypothetical protein POM88_031548 [Heracleum sosnowskyi]